MLKTLRRVDFMTANVLGTWKLYMRKYDQRVFDVFRGAPENVLLWSYDFVAQCWNPLPSGVYIEDNNGWDWTSYSALARKQNYDSRINVYCVDAVREAELAFVQECIVE